MCEDALGEGGESAMAAAAGALTPAMRNRNTCARRTVVVPLMSAACDNRMLRPFQLH